MTIRNRGQELTGASDGLPALSVPPHAKEKEHRLKKITGIFTRAMKDTWPQRLYYVDPFCGPGRCVIKVTGEETEGSPLIAARAPFTSYYFGDMDDNSIDTLKRRLKEVDLSKKRVFYYTGAADQTIDQILQNLPSRWKSLGLAVLDPWGWDFSFQSLKKLTDGRRLDLLINFNIGHMKRNWAEESGQLDSFLNLPTDHREFFNTETRGVPSARILLDHYEGELAKIGYIHHADDRAVRNSSNTPLYHFIFGSKNPLGKKLRDAVSTQTASGQLKMLD